MQEQLALISENKFTKSFYKFLKVLCPVKKPPSNVDTLLNDKDLN
jgi:hypothetical protein